MFDMVKRYNKFLSAFLATSLLLGGSSFRMASAEEVSSENSSQSQPSVENNSGNESGRTRKKLPIRRIRPKQKNWVQRHPIWTAVGAAGLIGVGYKIFKEDIPNPETIEFVERVIKKHDEQHYAYSLLYATKHGLDDLVIKLLDVIGDNNPNVINVREPSWREITPLTYACEHCTAATVRALLCHGANVKISGDVWEQLEKRINYNNLSRYSSDSFKDQTDIFVSLVIGGFRFNESQADVAGSRLTEILTRDQISTVDAAYAKTLIKAGAKVNIPDNNGCKPLTLAAAKGRTDIALQLISCAQDQITRIDKQDAIAAAGGNQAIIGLLNTLNPAH